VRFRDCLGERVDNELKAIQLKLWNIQKKRIRVSIVYKMWCCVHGGVVKSDPYSAEVTRVGKKRYLETEKIRSDI